MLKSDNYAVTMSGDLGSLAMDFVFLVHSFRKVLIDEMEDKDAAELLISDLGKLAFVDEDEDMEKRFNEIIENSTLLERRDRNE